MLWKLLVYTIHPPIVHVGITFQPSRPQISWERCDKNILMFENWRERKMKKITEQICSSSCLILVYTIHPPIVHVCTKFQLSRPHSSWEKCDENLNIWILEKEKIMERISSSSLILEYTIHPPMCVPSFNLLGLAVPDRSVRKILMFENWRERKWRNKGTNKQQQPDSSIHDTSAHCPRVYLVFNVLSLTVRENSVTKNFNVWKLERKKNEEIKGQISSSLIPVYMIHLPTIHMCTKFQSSRLHSSWKKCDENF